MGGGSEGVLRPKTPEGLRMRQSKTRPGKRRWKTRQGETRQDETRQGKKRCHKTRQRKTWKSTAKQDKKRQEKHSRTRQGKAWQAKQGKEKHDRQNKARKSMTGKTRQGKAWQAKQGKEKHDRQNKARKSMTGKTRQGCLPGLLISFCICSSRYCLRLARALDQRSLSTVRSSSWYESRPFCSLERTARQPMCTDVMHSQISGRVPELATGLMRTSTRREWPCSDNVQSQAYLCVLSRISVSYSNGGVGVGWTLHRSSK